MYFPQLFIYWNGTTKTTLKLLFRFLSNYLTFPCIFLKLVLIFLSDLQDSKHKTLCCLVTIFGDFSDDSSNLSSTVYTIIGLFRLEKTLLCSRLKHSRLFLLTFFVQLLFLVGVYREVAFNKLLSTYYSFGNLVEASCLLEVNCYKLNY